MYRLISYIFTAVLLLACTSKQVTDEEAIFVSILPLRSLVGEIVGDDFDIHVLVPPGASPETFEPSSRQFADLNRAGLIFSVGWIDFETGLLSKVKDTAKIVALNRGIEPIAGSCSHEGHSHAHGIDPHIWTSPRALQRMAANAYRAIHAAYPDSTKYTYNYQQLQERLRELDSRTAEKIARSGVTSFIVYHPALTYYARDYGLTQIAVENDGKEPSARRLSQLIRRAREESIGKIFYQEQFPASTVETIARDIHARCIEIDPLREDVIANIDSLTDLIVQP